MKLWDTPTCLMQRQCLAPNKEGFVPYHARQCGMWDVLEPLKTRIPVLVLDPFMPFIARKVSFVGPVALFCHPLATTLRIATIHSFSVETVPPCKSPPLRCVCLGYTFVSTCFTSFHLQPFTFVMFPQQLALIAAVFPSAIHVFLVFFLLLSISFVFSCFSSLCLASGFRWFSPSFHRCVVSAKASFLSPLFLKVFRSGLDGCEGKRGQKRFVPCNMKPLLPICVRVHNDLHS